MEELGTQKYTYTDTIRAHITANNQNQVPEGNFYMNVELIKNYPYMDQGLAGKSVREMSAWSASSLNGYVKVGKTLLPGGIRLMDDQAIRDKTGYTYNTTAALAGEIGIEPGPLPSDCMKCTFSK